MTDKQNYITKIPIIEVSEPFKTEPTFLSLPSVLNETTQQSFKMRIMLPKTDEIYSLQLRGLNQPFTMLIDGQPVNSSTSFSLGKTINFYATKQVTTIEFVVTPVNGRVGFLQTPTIAPLDTMQRFVFNQFATTLIIFCSFLIVSLYSFVIYAQKRFAFQLQISLYFFFISCSFFVSSDGMLDMFAAISNNLPLQLKTVAGLLTVIPLYILITTLYDRPLRKKAFSLLIILVTAAICSLFFVQKQMYYTLELSLWLLLITALFLFTCMLCYSFYQQKELSLKHVVLIQALLYLCIHLSLRLYYTIFGTNVQTMLWLLMFIFNIFLYVLLHHRNLAHELNLSKQEVLQSKISFFNAQIKPHFIYNALSNIMALCYVDNMKAAHLLGKFSTYLRIIFENNNSNDAITLQKELSLIDAYVEIEQA
ncbi:MAG: histidine kinase, partial [Caryophanon sp.]|nr:histidine kinase [Caryophanon sp.]